MQTPVEDNKHYQFPQDTCYAAIKASMDKINIKWTQKFFDLISTPSFGHVNIGMVEDDWRAHKVVGKFRFDGIIQYTWGPPIKLYARSTGGRSCMVEIVADAAKFYDGKVMNYFLDTAYKKVPIYSRLIRNIMPSMYFDDILIMNGTNVESRSFQNDIGIIALKYTFSRLQTEISTNLKRSSG